MSKILTASFPSPLHRIHSPHLYIFPLSRVASFICVFSFQDEAILSLKCELKEAHDVMSSQNEEMKNLLENVSESSNQITDMEETISSLNSDITALKDQSVCRAIENCNDDSDIAEKSTPQSETSFLDQKLGCIGGGLSNLNKKAQSGLEKAKHSEPTQFSVLNPEPVHECATHVEEIAKLKTDVDLLRCAKESLEQFMVEKDKEFDYKKVAILEVAQTDKAALQEAIGTLKTENEKLDGELTKLQAEFESNVISSNSLAVDVDIAKQLNSTLENELKHVEDDLNRVKVENEALTEEISILTREQNNKDDLIANLRSEKEMLVSKEEKYRVEIESLRVEFNNMSDDYHKVKSELEARKESGEGFSKELDVLRMELGDRLKDVEKLEEKQVTLLREKTQLAEELLALSSKIAALETEESQLKHFVGSLQHDSKQGLEKLKEFTEERNKLQVVNETLNKQITEIKVKILDLLFASENKERASFDDQDVSVIIEAVRKSIVQLSNRLMENMEKDQKLHDLNETVISMQNMLAAAEENNRIKTDRVNAMNEVLLTQDKTMEKQDREFTELSKS